MNQRRDKEGNSNEQSPIMGYDRGQKTQAEILPSTINSGQGAFTQTTLSTLTINTPEQKGKKKKRQSR